MLNGNRLGKFRAALLLRPMPPALFIPVTLIVLIAGAAYCLGYEELQSGRAKWPLGLLWAAYAVWPWLFVFELIKRREWDRDRPLPITTIALLMIATGALSLLLEGASDRWLLHKQGSPLALQIMRRLPAIAATILLLLLARREQRSAEALASAPPEAAEAEAETLRRHAKSIRWIRAADNYLELHLEGQVWTRRITMREAAEILEPLGFVRVHRSVIVNRSHVSSVVPQSGGAAIRMADGTALPTGKAYGDNLRRLERFVPSSQRD